MPTAVITGGSSGLGAACVEAFREAGYRVASIDLAMTGSREDVLEVSADITDVGSVARAFEEVTTTLGAPSALVHAAGIYPRSTLADATTDSYRRIFDVNVLGTVLVDQAFARTAPRGSVAINIASVDGIEPFGLSILYSASKAAVISLTAGIADELAEQGIRVLALAPGYIATDTVKEIKRSRGEEMPPDASEPIDIGRTCVRLCADGGIGLVTGQTLVVKTTALDRG
jgi:3-oxoacyl-[acyl-carrier protein] reductase